MAGPLANLTSSVLSPLMGFGDVRNLTRIAEAEQRRYLRLSEMSELTRKMQANGTPITVRRGPFEEVKFPASNKNEWTYTPKVIGSYEEEIH